VELEKSWDFWWIWLDFEGPAVTISWQIAHETSCGMRILKLRNRDLTPQNMLQLRSTVAVHLLRVFLLQCIFVFPLLAVVTFMMFWHRK
jgi:hypothetical protein